MPEIRSGIDSERRSGIGGSDIAALLGVSLRKTRYDLYLEKTDPVLSSGGLSPSGNSSFKYWGLNHEKLIAKAYTELTGRYLRRCNSVIRDENRPYFLGHLDFLVCPAPGKLPRTPQGEIRTELALECVTSFLPGASWGASGTGMIPIQYALKLQWYMGLLPMIKAFDIAVLFGGRDFRIYRIQRDDKMISYLREKADFFWRENVLKRIPPRPATENEVRKMYPVPADASVPATSSVSDMLVRYISAELERLNAEKVRRELRDRIISYMGSCSSLKNHDGVPLATFRRSANGKRVFKITKNGMELLNPSDKNNR